MIRLALSWLGSHRLLVGMAIQGQEHFVTTGAKVVACSKTKPNPDRISSSFLFLPAVIMQYSFLPY